jgi:hypothetical protein
MQAENWPDATVNMVPKLNGRLFDDIFKPQQQKAVHRRENEFKNTEPHNKSDSCKLYYSYIKQHSFLRFGCLGVDYIFQDI